MVNLLSGIRSSSAALDAERIRMEVISQNIANVNTTRGLDGKPYQRQQVVFETVLLSASPSGSATGPGSEGVRIARVEPDHSPPHVVYNPGHPDADAEGMLALPNINIHAEMVDLISSSRAYEANLAVVKNARAMAIQALSIGKR